MIHRPTHARLARRSAFTLLEILIVVAIIVMLAGAGTYYFLQRLEDARVSTARTQVNTLANAAQQYSANNNGLPQALEQLTQPQPSGGGPYFDAKQLIDPWGKPYQYNAEGPNNQGNKPDVWTTSPRGITIGNW
jgi:general secretion pathway protein G